MCDDKDKALLILNQIEEIVNTGMSTIEKYLHIERLIKGVMKNE